MTKTPSFLLRSDLNWLVLVGIALLLQFWWKAVLRMWNNPKAAPEYQMGWGDKVAVKKSLKRILDWDFGKIILAHGNLIEHDARAVATKAWEKVLQES